MIRRARWSDGRAERKRWRWEIKRETEGVERERERGGAEGWKQVASRLRLVSGPFVIVNIAEEAKIIW